MHRTHSFEIWSLVRRVIGHVTTCRARKKPLWKIRLTKLSEIPRAGACLHVDCLGDCNPYCLNVFTGSNMLRDFSFQSYSLSSCSSSCSDWFPSWGAAQRDYTWVILKDKLRSLNIHLKSRPRRKRTRTRLFQYIMKINLEINKTLNSLKFYL